MNNLVVRNHFYCKYRIKINFLLNIFYAFVILLSITNNAFCQKNNVDYPDWENRFPATERYDHDCGPLFNRGQYGPFDYRTLSPGDRELVDGAHFSYEYQAYLLGQTRSTRPGNPGPPAAGFGYTLWAFPNQVRALAAMEDLGIRHKTETPPGAKMRVHCYFQRAVRFAPDDAEVRALYGYYYARRKNIEGAKEQLQKAAEGDSQKSSVLVYIAFSYIEIKDYEKALVAAKQAYASGHSLPGLRNRLQKLGVWRD